MPASTTVPSLPAAHLCGHLEALLREMHHSRDLLTAQFDGQIERVSSLLGRIQAESESKIVPHSPDGQVSQPLSTAPRLTSVFLAPESEKIDPELEDATLAELNSALSAAFSEIASRGGMLVNSH